MRKRAAKIGTINYAPRKVYGKRIRGVEHGAICVVKPPPRRGAIWRARLGANRNNSFSNKFITRRPSGEIFRARARERFLHYRRNYVVEFRLRINGVCLLRSRESSAPFSKFANGSRRVATGTRRFDSPGGEWGGGGRRKEAAFPVFLSQIFRSGREFAVSREAGQPGCGMCTPYGRRDGPPRRVASTTRPGGDAMSEREARIMASASCVCLRGVYPRPTG